MRQELILCDFSVLDWTHVNGLLDADYGELNTYTFLERHVPSIQAGILVNPAPRSMCNMQDSTLFFRPVLKVLNHFGLTTYSGTLWNDSSTIARYRIIESSKIRKTLWNPARTTRPYEIESIFIKMSWPL